MRETKYVNGLITSDTIGSTKLIRIERYIARLVAKGYNHIKRLDYLDTFSLVKKLTSV